MDVAVAGGLVEPVDEQLAAERPADLAGDGEERLVDGVRVARVETAARRRSSVASPCGSTNSSSTFSVTTCPVFVCFIVFSPCSFPGFPPGSPSRPPRDGRILRSIFNNQQTKFRNVRLIPRVVYVSHATGLFRDGIGLVRSARLCASGRCAMYEDCALLGPSGLPADSGVRRALRYGFPRIVRALTRTRRDEQHPGAIGAVVARFPDTEEVTGSNPVSPTNSQHFTVWIIHVDIAQLVERDLAKVEVASSNLVVHSKKYGPQFFEEGSFFGFPKKPGINLGDWRSGSALP